MARRLAENIQTDHLSCPICRDTLSDPRILPCEHTLCLDCLTQLIRSSRRLNKFTCPVDRREITAPTYTISDEEWANTFPKDDLALILIQTISGDRPQATKKTGIPCSEHTDQFCDFFCFGCSKFVCSECAVVRHRHSNCDCRPLSKCTQHAKVQLEHVQEEMENLISYGKDIVSRENSKDNLLLKSRNQIQDTIMKLKNIVLDFEKMALRNFIDILGKVEGVADVDKIKDRAANIVLELETVRNEMDTSNLKTTTDILATLSKIPDKLQRYISTLYSLGVTDEPIELKLELNESFIKLCEKLVDQPVGTIHVVPADSLDFEETETKLCGQRIKFSSDVLPSRAIELQPYIAIQPEPVEQCTRRTPRFTALIMHSHSVIVVDNANFKVQRFRDNVENQFIDEVIVPDVYGITMVCGSDDILVTAPGKCPRLVRLSTYTGLSTITEDKTDHPYYNICQLPHSRYAVICHSFPRRPPNRRVYFQWTRGVTSHIDILDTDYQLLASLQEDLICEPNEFGNPITMPLKSICGLRNGNIVVTIDTKTSNFISCVTQGGRIKWTYNLNDIPEGVCCDEESIYTFLRESKVVRKLSYEGDLKPICTLRLPNYESDGNTLVICKRYIAVADRSDIVRIYDMERDTT